MESTPPILTSPPWTGRTKRLIALLAAGAVVFAFMRLSDILPIIAVAVILGYVLTPIANFLERWLPRIWPMRGRMRRTLAVLLTYLILATAIILVILVVVPVLVRQLEQFGRQIPVLLADLETSLEQTLSEPLVFNGEPILIEGAPFVPLERLRAATGAEHISDLLQIQDVNVVGTTQQFIGSLSGPAFSFVGGALTAIINTVLLLSMMFFLMRDGALFIEKAVQVTPALYRGDLRRMLYELGRVWNAYLRGQLSLALFMGTAVFLVAALVGLPNPLILGMLSFLLEFIPSIGAGLAIFPAALLALTSQSSTLPFLEGLPFALVVTVIWAALQNLEAFILVPRVMGGSLNLHPFVVIVAIIAGAALAGLLGIILAAPAVASLRVVGQYIYGKLMDREPFPRATRPVGRSFRVVFADRLRWPLEHDWVVRIGMHIRERLQARRKEDHA